jgi:hypothetical protein
MAEAGLLELSWVPMRIEPWLNAFDDDENGGAGRNRGELPDTRSSDC